MNYSGVCFPFVLKTCAMMDVDKQNRAWRTSYAEM